MKRNKVSVEHGEHVTTIIVEPQWPEGVRDKVPTPEQPTTCLIMFAIVALGFCATVLHAVTDTMLQRVIVVLVVGPVFVAILGRIKRLHREDEERFNRQMNILLPVASGSRPDADLKTHESANVAASRGGATHGWNRSTGRESNRKAKSPETTRSTGNFFNLTSAQETSNIPKEDVR